MCECVIMVPTGVQTHQQPLLFFFSPMYVHSRHDIKFVVVIVNAFLEYHTFAVFFQARVVLETRAHFHLLQCLSLLLQSVLTLSEK